MDAKCTLHGLKSTSNVYQLGIDWTSTAHQINIKAALCHLVHSIFLDLQSTLPPKKIWLFPSKASELARCFCRTYLFCFLSSFFFLSHAQRAASAAELEQVAT